MFESVSSISLPDGTRFCGWRIDAPSVKNDMVQTVEMPQPTSTSRRMMLIQPLARSCHSLVPSLGPVQRA